MPPDPEITLREHFDVRFSHLEKQLNEINVTLKEQAKNFISRVEYEALLTDIRSLRESRASLEGKATQESVTRVMLISLAGVLIGLVSMIISLAR
jgi:hypothetical protein